MEIELAVQDEAIPEVVVNREVRASITIILPGSRLPVRVRNAIIWVAEMEINSVLLSRDLLGHLGWNFTKYLSENYDSVKDTEVKCKVKFSSYTGLTYGDQHDDPIEPRIDSSEQYGDDISGEFDAALGERVSEDQSNGFSEKGKPKLREMIKKHVNVFGIKPGTKPPADIKPFKVLLKPDGKPVRASQRRYGPIQQPFIEESIKNL